MAKDDFTVEIKDGRIIFMTSYRDEFGEECKVANIISEEKLVEMRDSVNSALEKIDALDIPVKRLKCQLVHSPRQKIACGKVGNNCKSCQYSYTE